MAYGRALAGLAELAQIPAQRSLVYIEGRLKTSWEDKDGNKKILQQNSGRQPDHAG